MSYVLALILLLVLAIPVSAQSIADLYQVTLKSGNAYRQAHNEYQLAKNQHIQYNTAATRTDAIEKTKNVLTARNTLQSDYLEYLRSYLAESTNIANYTQTVTYLDLESEVKTLDSYPATFSSLTTFEGINTASEEWEKRLKVSTNLAGASRIQIASAHLANLHAQVAAYAQQYIANHPEGSSTLDIINQKLQSAESIRLGVDRDLSGYKSTSWSKSTSVSKLKQSQQLLIEAAELLDELNRK